MKALWKAVRACLTVCPVIALSWASVAQEAQKPAPTQDEQRDAAVLEAVLVDILTDRKSPLETSRNVPGRVCFAVDPMKPKGFLGKLSIDSILPTDDSEWKKLSPAAQGLGREAATEVQTGREVKEFFTKVRPTDKRIVLYRNDPKDKPSEEARQAAKRALSWSVQVFRACPPGYSKDRTVAVVFLMYTWSDGFHGADATYILEKLEKGWKIILRKHRQYV
jgi:hypothetical protein